MAAHRRLDRRRDGLCAVGLRKRAWQAHVAFFSLMTDFLRLRKKDSVMLPLGLINVALYGLT
jgi:hypothetical protein